MPSDGFWTSIVSIGYDDLIDNINSFPLVLVKQRRRQLIWNFTRIVLALHIGAMAGRWRD